MDSDKSENIEEGSASEGAPGGNGSIEENSHVTKNSKNVRNVGVETALKRV